MDGKAEASNKNLNFGSASAGHREIELWEQEYEQRFSRERKKGRWGSPQRGTVLPPLQVLTTHPLPAQSSALVYCVTP